ncbi:TPA: hypothetical protein RVS58_RS25010 [Escherichia coli]|nr:MULTISPECIES: hypothetical protein [Escherichia]UGJ66146.1 hypothetical protein LQT56_25730 [Escherichia coli]HDD9792033.1 hypothetical protein [Escherichia coli]
MLLKINVETSKRIGILGDRIICFSMPVLAVTVRIQSGAWRSAGVTGTTR